MFRIVDASEASSFHVLRLSMRLPVAARCGVPIVGLWILQDSNLHCCQTCACTCQMLQGHIHLSISTLVTVAPLSSHVVSWGCRESNPALSYIYNSSCIPMLQAHPLVGSIHHEPSCLKTTNQRMILTITAARLPLKILQKLK